MLRAVALFERRHRGSRLFLRYSRFQPTDDTQETCAKHHPLIGKPGDDVRFGRPDFGVWSGPQKWEVRQNTDDRVRHTVERDAASNHAGVAPQALLPEILRHHRDGALNDRPRKKRSLIKLKIAVFSPIPSASMSNASKVNPGDFASVRTAYLRSVNMISQVVIRFAAQ